MRTYRLSLGSAGILLLIVSSISAAETRPQELHRERHTAATPLQLAEEGQPTADIVLLTDSELLHNAAEWIAAFVERNSGATLSVVGGSTPVQKGRHIVAAVGQNAPWIERLTNEGKLRLEPSVGPQGFVLQRLTDPEAGEVLLCWSPEPLGCRYGLIEILRSLTVDGKSVRTDLGRVVERPQFPTRICYLNFAEHLQNAFNPNVLFDVPDNRWATDDWDRLIDMLSAFRYNVFEFWLVPTLFSSDALQGGKIPTQFAATINHVIAYAKRRGVSVHPIQAVNTVGREWHYHCPNDPKERAEIFALWDHWSRALRGNESIGFFPGDPGGCCRNGCTPATYVDLCLELAKVVRKNNPAVRIEVGTWGEPFGGWGVPLWTGNRQRAESSMRYFLSKLPELPAGTFTSINQGFSPDCDPNSHGGDGRPFARQAAKICPVLTWDYSVSEGEGTVSPRCRVRRMFQTRQAELALGCYSGGICYTMAPKLNCLSIFCCGEAWWNPALKPDDVLGDFGRFAFGDALATIGPLMEEFEVIPDWGYYPPFPYSPKRLQESMAKLMPLLRSIAPETKPRLPLAATMPEYRKSLLFYADLFHTLASIAVDLEEAQAIAKTSGRVPGDRQKRLSLAELEKIINEPADFPQKAALRKLVERLRQYDVSALRKTYGDTVYGIYNSGIPAPVDPRDTAATNNLFNRFDCELLTGGAR